MVATHERASGIRFSGVAPHWTRTDCNRCGEDIVYQKGDTILVDVHDNIEQPVCIACATLDREPAAHGRTSPLVDHEEIRSERVMERDGFKIRMTVDRGYSRHSDAAPCREKLMFQYEDGESISISLYPDTPSHHPLRGLWRLLVGVSLIDPTDGDDFEF